MYFSYTYSPNLTHQGASVITKKIAQKNKKQWMKKPTQHTTNNYGRITFNLERYPQKYAKKILNFRAHSTKEAHVN
jgi:hypothetical protein